MLIVGITGGIGSGKTTVSKVFEKLGIPVYRSDDESKRLLNTNQELKAKLIEQFGEQVYMSENELNRTWLAQQVFRDQEKLKVLNNIVHPAVRKDFIQWTERQQSPYILKEAAILIESNTHLDCDKIIMVAAPAELRIARAMQRDGLTMEDVKNRISKQMPDDEKQALCDYVIYNDDSQSVIVQVLTLHETLMNMATTRNHAL